MKSYISVSDYLKAEYGEKIYKVSIDGGFTCPNRDGTVGTGGCIFCSKGGSGDFAESRDKSITDQIESGKKKVLAKLPKDKNHKFIAYFQAFTNTYADVGILRKRFMEAVNHPDVVIVSIATRPDCLGEEVIKLLKEINEIKPVWVELGLQTIHESTAEYIRRGYPLGVYDEAVRKLKEADIKVITHVIIGLPGESPKDMLDTVKYVVDTRTFGIKLALLHVLRDTDLAIEYEAGNIKTLELEEYLDIIGDCVKVISKNMVIHRLTGDGDKRTLIAPMWSADKKKVLNALNRKLSETV